MKLAHRILLFSVALLTLLMLVIVLLVEGPLYDRIIDERVERLIREARLIGAQWKPGTDAARLARESSSALAARVTLIDGRGVIVADAAPEGVPTQSGGTVASRPEIEQARARSVGVAVSTSPAGDWEDLYVAVSGPRGIARVAVPTRELVQIFHGARRDLLTAGLVALAIATFFSLLYARYVSQPVIELRDMAQALAERDFRPRKVRPAPGEVGELAVTLAELSTRLESLERVRREFVANVSHELRTPLTIASGYAATLAKNDAPLETRQRFVNSILANTQRMQRVVDDLLDLSKIEAGGWTPQIQSVELSGVVAEIKETFQPAYNAKGIAFVADLSPDTETVRADFTALRQVLANLVENAIRHTASGSITVFSNADPRGVWVGVRDTGEGIAPEHLPRIFERFYRVDKARSRESGGTGLGLAIVRHMAEAHGGLVKATSRPGSGTTIRVFFPHEAKHKTPPRAHTRAV